MFIDLLNFSKALCLYKLKDHEVTCTVQTYIHHISLHVCFLTFGIIEFTHSSSAVFLKIIGTTNTVRGTCTW